jgi:hypothetical protein
MNSIRTTNILLLIIAVSLVTNAASQLSVSIIPEARAGYPSEFQNIVLYGCFKGHGDSGPCVNKQIVVDASGRLIISK